MVDNYGHYLHATMRRHVPGAIVSDDVVRSSCICESACTGRNQYVTTVKRAVPHTHIRIGRSASSAPAMTPVSVSLVNKINAHNIAISAIIYAFVRACAQHSQSVSVELNKKTNNKTGRAHKSKHQRVQCAGLTSIRTARCA